MMHILLLESYDTGSHAAWMRGYQQHSQHQVSILSLPGNYWKWRMQGGAVSLARLYHEADLQPDVIVASDMLDLTTFRALTAKRTAGVPIALYFHENQLTYPPGPRQRQTERFRYGFINYVSALAADAVFFNSHFHLDALYDELPRLLKQYADFNELQTVAELRAKSTVLPPGLDLRRFDAYRPTQDLSISEPPLILWNHRWEADKNPRPFLNALVQLAKQGYDFQVALTGENFRKNPREFLAARNALGLRVVQFGYVESFAEYARLLWRADVQVSTAYQDFFGMSTCEAIYCGCRPFLVNRLNYPALLPTAYREALLFDEGRIYDRLRAYLTNPQPAPPQLRAHVSQFDWLTQAPHYDTVFAGLAATAG